MCGGCASVAPQDDLCVEISLFANAADRATEHAVELTTDWGGLFSNEKNVLAQKSCKHDGSIAGKQFCAYLMSNTSTEFATLNINRALRCIGVPQIPQSREYNFRFVRLAAKVEAEAKGVRDGILVGVEYEIGLENKPPSLKIYAKTVD